MGAPPEDRVGRAHERTLDLALAPKRVQYVARPSLSCKQPQAPPLRTHALNVRISLAATGPFLAVVPGSVMSALGKYPSIRVLPVELPTALRQIGVFTLKKRSLSPLAQRVIECARELAKSLTERR